MAHAARTGDPERGGYRFNGWRLERRDWSTAMEYRFR
jgi:hypothetical protein